MDTGPTVAAAGDSPRLVVVEGYEIGRVFALTKETTSIGRDPSNDIVLPFPTVSRSHAVIVVHGGEIMARDLGSRNGTFVGGARIVHRALVDGDVIIVGDRVALELRSRAAPEGAAAVTAPHYVPAWVPRAVGVKTLLERLRNERSAPGAAVSLVLMFVRIDPTTAPPSGHDVALEDLMRQGCVACGEVLEADDLLARVSARELVILLRGEVERALVTAERLRARLRGASLPSIALVPIPARSPLGEDAILLVASQRAGHALSRAPHTISTVRLDGSAGPSGLEPTG